MDVTAQVGAAWSEFFTTLELQHDLNINNMHHIWLLHHLFLSLINQQLQFFVEAWNQHRIQIRNGPNRSPADLFGFDMLVHGIHGDQLPNEVSMYAPSSGALTSDELAGLAQTVHPWYSLPGDENRLSVWLYGLGYARAIRGDIF